MQDPMTGMPRDPASGRPYTTEPVHTRTSGGSGVFFILGAIVVALGVIFFFVSSNDNTGVDQAPAVPTQSVPATPDAPAAGGTTTNDTMTPAPEATTPAAPAAPEAAPAEQGGNGTTAPAPAN